MGKVSKSNLSHKIKQETTSIYVRTKADYLNEINAVDVVVIFLTRDYPGSWTTGLF